MLGQTIVPGDLIFQSEMGIRRARVRDDKERGFPYRPRLWTQHAHGPFLAERVPREWTVRGHPVETRNKRSVALQKTDQPWRPLAIIIRTQRRGIVAWNFHNIGKTDTEVEKERIIRRSQVRAAERCSDRFAEARTRKGRPEAVRGSGKVVALLHRVQRWIDPDKEDVETRGEVIGQGRKRVLVQTIHR